MNVAIFLGAIVAPTRLGIVGRENVFINHIVLGLSGARSRGA